MADSGLLRDVRVTPLAVAVALMCGVLSYGIVQQPWLLVGLVSGAIVLTVAIAAPLALVACTLMLGAIDLSAMTGGFKSLFPQLGGLDMNGIRLVGATVGFAAYIVTTPTARNAVFSRAVVPYLIFLVYAFITLAGSLDALEGLRLHLKLAYPLLTFLLVVGLCDNRERLDTLTNYTLMAAAVIIFLVNPLFTLEGGYRIDPDGFRRVRSVSGHENPFSFYLMIMLFIGFTRLVYRKQARYLLLSLGAALWIILTMTRITFLATIVGILIIALLASVRQRHYRALAAAGLVTAVLVIGGLPYILNRSLGFLPTPSELLSLLSNPEALYSAINWQGRTNLWPIVWTGFMASPVVGLGLGSSSVVIRQHFPAEAASVAHNEYLRLAADTGVVGVTLFTIAMLVWLGTMLRPLRGDNTHAAEYAVPAVAGIAAWAIIAITDNPFDSYMYFTQYVGFLAGATVAMRAITAKGQNVDHRFS